LKLNLILFCSVFVLFFAGCTGLVSSGDEEVVALNDCASDFSCFVSAMGNNCEKAKVQLLENGVTSLLEVKGAEEGGKCNVRIKILDIQKTPEMPDEVWSGVQAAKAGISILYMDCPIGAQEAQALYEQKQMTSAKEVFEKCEGSLKNVAMLIVGKGIGGQEANALSLEASVFPAEIASGETAIIAASAGGGKGGYLYSFEKEGEAASEYSAQSSIDVVYTNGGDAQVEKSVKVKVKDADNKIVEKTVKVKVNPASGGEPVQPEGAGEASCTETDLGQEVRIRGITYVTFADGSNITHVDECVGETEVIEYYCGGEEDAIELHATCETLFPGSHCSKGACIKNENACYDSENGMENFSVAGTVTSSGVNGWSNNFDDTCMDMKSLKEYRCPLDPMGMWQQCPDGESCINGACVKKWVSCTDTEPFAYYGNKSIKGTSTLTTVGGAVETYTDVCTSQGMLTEYVCNSDNSTLNIYTYNCPQGQSCSDGACVGEIIPCIDSDGGEFDYEHAGYVSVYQQGGGVGTAYDYCYGAWGQKLSERYCSGGMEASKIVDCPAGKKCQSGACVPA